jgi:hypothetical protein
MTGNASLVLVFLFLERYHLSSKGGGMSCPRCGKKGTHMGYFSWECFSRKDNGDAGHCGHRWTGDLPYNPLFDEILKRAA